MDIVANGRFETLITAGREKNFFSSALENVDRIMMRGTISSAQSSDNVIYART